MILHHHLRRGFGPPVVKVSNHGDGDNPRVAELQMDRLRCLAVAIRVLISAFPHRLLFLAFVLTRGFPKIDAPE